ncbi:hypothetical protein D1007_09728 [Hordeum vulgare]|nr:hypothetical protein D1007_09728 [Hordeum vulgare]
MWEKLGIINLMQFNKDFDSKMVDVFFATVHLGADEARALTWMTNGMLLSAPWKEFIGLLGYDDQWLDNPIRFCPHKETVVNHKSHLYPFSTKKISSTTRKSTFALEPFQDIMHHIFQHSLFPRVGNLDQSVRVLFMDLT